MNEIKDFLSYSDILLELDRLDFENSEPSDSFPSISLQKKIMKKLLNASMKPVDIWCLVTKKWFDSWKRYVGFDDLIPPTGKKPGKISNEKLLCDDNDNDDQIRDRKSTSTHGKLKESITQGVDYEVIHCTAFSTFLRWYGGRIGGYAPTIARPTFSSKEEDNLFMHRNSIFGSKDKSEDVRIDLKPFHIFCGTFTANLTKMEYKRIRVFKTMRLSDVKQYIIEKFGVLQLNHSIESSRILILKRIEKKKKKKKNKQRKKSIIIIEEEEEEEEDQPKSNFRHFLRMCEYEEIEIGNLLLDPGSTKLILECRLRFKEFYFDKYFESSSQPEEIIDPQVLDLNTPTSSSFHMGGEFDVSVLPQTQQKVLLKQSSESTTGGENLHRFRKDVKKYKNLYEKEKKRIGSLEKQFTNDRKKLTKQMKKKHSEKVEKQKHIIRGLKDRIFANEENVKKMQKEHQEKIHSLKTKLIRYCEERISLKTTNVHLEKKVRESESKLMKLGPGLIKIFTVSEQEMMNEQQFSIKDLKIMKSDIFQNIHLLLSKIRVIDESITQREQDKNFSNSSYHQVERCSICQESEKDQVCIPCGHLLCSSCCEEMFENRNRKKCPFCQKKVEFYQKIYMSV